MTAVRTAVVSEFVLVSSDYCTVLVRIPVGGQALVCRSRIVSDRRGGFGGNRRFVLSLVMLVSLRNGVRRDFVGVVHRYLYTLLACLFGRFCCTACRYCFFVGTGGVVVVYRQY